jgi:polysaccharide biosynthesis transport protein
MIATENKQHTTENQPSGASSGSPGRGFKPMRVLLERRWQLLACLLVVCAIAFSATALQQPWFEAVARVEVVMDKPEIGGGAAAALGAGGDYFNTQCQLLRSRRVLSRASEKLNLSPGHWNYSDEGLMELRKSLKVKPISGSRLIDIVGVADNGAKAAAIANQVTVAFIETSIEARRATNSHIVERMKSQIEDYNRQIEAAEELTSQFRAEHLIGDKDSSLSATEDRIRMIEQQVTNSQMKRLELESQREQLNQMLTTGRGLSEEDTAPPEILSDPTVMSLRQSVNQLKQEESQMAQAYLPGHQKLRSVRMQIVDLQTKLMDQKHVLMKALFDRCTEQYAAVVKQEQSLSGLLNQQKEMNVQQTNQQQHYQNIQQDLEKLKNFRAQCVTQMREFILQEEMNESPVAVVDAAQIPLQPAGLKKTHQAASILLLGLLFSLGFIFTLDRLSHPAAMETPYGVPTMYVPVNFPMMAAETADKNYPNASVSPKATVQPSRSKKDSNYTQTPSGIMEAWLNKIDLGGDGYDNLAFQEKCRIVHTDQSSPQAESFRAVSTQLLSRFWKTRQSLVVTSRETQCGKTISACNLALALAKAGRKVLLVDANQDSPVLHHVFTGARNKPDFHQVVHDPAAMEQAARDSEISTLCILTAAQDETLKESYDAAMLARFDNEAKQLFDWIIYDGGTIHQQRTKTLLQATGRSLFVMTDRCEFDRRSACEELEHHGAMNLGFLENSFNAGASHYVATSKVSNA